MTDPQNTSNTRQSLMSVLAATLVILVLGLVLIAVHAPVVVIAVLGVAVTLFFQRGNFFPKK